MDPYYWLEEETYCWPIERMTYVGMFKIFYANNGNVIMKVQIDVNIR